MKKAKSRWKIQMLHPRLVRETSKVKIKRMMRKVKKVEKMRVKNKMMMRSMIIWE